jgi:hypothetical protein
VSRSVSQAVALRGRQSSNILKNLARPRGVEPLTPRSVVWCSIQLSYGRVAVKRTGRPGVDNYPSPLRQRKADRRMRRWPAAPETKWDGMAPETTANPRGGGSLPRNPLLQARFCAHR